VLSAARRERTNDVARTGDIERMNGGGEREAERASSRTVAQSSPRVAPC
jgi:hypothetical protein